MRSGFLKINYGHVYNKLGETMGNALVNKVR